MILKNIFNVCSFYLILTTLHYNECLMNETVSVVLFTHRESLKVYELKVPAIISGMSTYSLVVSLRGLGTYNGAASQAFLTPKTSPLCSQRTFC